MKQNIEAELLSHELGMSYLRPKKATWKVWAEDIAAVLAIVLFVSVLIWLTAS